MGMNFILKKVSLLFLGVFFILLKADAADESYVNSLEGPITAGSTLTVTDDKFLNLPLAQWNQVNNLSVDNIITFELRNDVPIFYYSQSFICTLKLSIQYFTSRDQQTPTQLDNISLVVKYDKNTGAYY